MRTHTQGVSPLHTPLLRLPYQMALRRGTYYRPFCLGMLSSVEYASRWYIDSQMKDKQPDEEQTCADGEPNRVCATSGCDNVRVLLLLPLWAAFARPVSNPQSGIVPCYVPRALCWFFMPVIYAGDICRCLEPFPAPCNSIWGLLFPQAERRRQPAITITTALPKQIVIVS